MSTAPVLLAMTVFMSVLNRRLIFMQENRDAWLRFCCTRRRGLRYRIDNDGFPTPSENMTAMYRVDYEMDRIAECNEKWPRERDVSDAMPK